METLGRRIARQRRHRGLTLVEAQTSGGQSVKITL